MYDCGLMTHEGFGTPQLSKEDEHLKKKEREQVSSSHDSLSVPFGALSNNSGTLTVRDPKDLVFFKTGPWDFKSKRTCEDSFTIKLDGYVR
jgi:hypothetical protein